MSFPAGSSPPPESSLFLCPLLSLFIPLLVAPQCHLSNDVLVFRLSLHLLSTTLLLTDEGDCNDKKDDNYDNDDDSPIVGNVKFRGLAILEVNFLK